MITDHIIILHTIGI